MIILCILIQPTKQLINRRFYFLQRPLMYINHISINQQRIEDDWAGWANAQMAYFNLLKYELLWYIILCFYPKLQSYS